MRQIDPVYRRASARFSLMGLLKSGITHVRLLSPYSRCFSRPQARIELEIRILFSKLEASPLISKWEEHNR